MDLGFFGIIDIFVVLFGILFLFLGFRKGFMNKMIGLLAVLVIIGLSIVLASNFAEFLKNRDIFYPSIYNGIYDNVKETVDANPGSSTADIIGSALNMPSLIASFIASKIDVEPALLPEAVASVSTKYIMRVIAFFILVVAFTIVFIILKLIAKAARSNSVIRTVDGVLGMALYFLIYMTIISLLFFVLNIFVTKGVISGGTLEFIQTDLQLNTDSFRLSKFLYEGNIFNSVKELFS